MSCEEHNVKRSCSYWQRPPPQKDIKAVSQHIHCSQHGVFTNGTEASPQKRPCSPAMGLASIRSYVITSPCLVASIPQLPTALAWQVHHAEDRSILLDHVDLTQ